MKSIKVIFGLFLLRVSAMSGIKSLACVSSHCLMSSVACFRNVECRRAVMCNQKCLKSDNEAACNLLCQLTVGYDNKKYINLLRCMAAHNCLPKLPPDGKCMAKAEDGIKELTDLSQIEGSWWILKGLNCGQPGWPAGFDAFPCQSDRFYKSSNDGVWRDSIEYCGGSNNTCTTPFVHTFADVELSSPGVMRHIYKDAPLLPQNEDWILLSWPHPDWMLYVYCGSTPTGEYGGASVVARPYLNIEDIPAYVEKEFKRVAFNNGFTYDEMCVSDVRQCPPNQSASP